MQQKKLCTDMRLETGMMAVAEVVGGKFGRGHDSHAPGTLETITPAKKDKKKTKQGDGEASGSWPSST
jgi:hypothetical protein